MRIMGAENLTAEEVRAELARGGRLVFFEYCISLVLVTLRRPSPVYLLRAGEHGLLKGLPYTVLSLLLGWWGVPWGFIYTPLTLWTNLAGGRDVTAALQGRLLREDRNDRRSGKTAEEG
ncbi:MAG TPA: hypothetical protein VNK04_25160 [Gemmataceae bacterium]|nr:hypothetical protein [Gemmataceae bacterium]